jgi:hypothetical protein
MSEKVATILRVKTGKELHMDSFKVVFIRANDNKVYGNFTANSIYLARYSKVGYLTVIDDTGTLTEMPVTKFDIQNHYYSRNWLAYCKQFELDPEHQPKSLIDFVLWINEKSVEFRKLHHFSKDYPIGQLESWILFLENGGVPINQYLIAQR